MVLAYARNYQILMPEDILRDNCYDPELLQPQITVRLVVQKARRISFIS